LLAQLPTQGARARRSAARSSEAIFFYTAERVVLAASAWCGEKTSIDGYAAM
jgi:hypothetical protein